MGYLLFFNGIFLQGSQHRTTSQEEEEEGHKAQHAQEGQHTTDATQALLLAIGQLLREQHQNQTHQGRKDQTEDKGPAKTNRSTATQHTHQGGQETAAQQGKNQYKSHNYHCLRFNIIV